MSAPAASPSAAGAPRRVRRASYLALLTPERAFRLFLAALVASVVLIVAGARPAWLSVLPVLAYGAALLVAQRRHLVALGGTVKDSPYFLGFILTMVGLAKIFHDVAGGPRGESTVAAVVGEAGAAILATIAGLFARQVLMSLDPGEDARDAVFQSLARELRERTLDFHETQAHFVGLVREFVAARETLFSREEAALALYVERLELGGARLRELAEHYPRQAEQLFRMVEASSERLREAADASERRIASLPERLAADIERESAALAGSLAEHRRRVSEAHEETERAVRGAAGALIATVAALQPRIAELDASAGCIPEASRTLADALGGLATVSSDVRSGFAEMSDTVRDSTQALDDTVQTVRDDAQAMNGVVRERALAMRGELAEVDGVVDELIAVLRQRLERVADRA